MSDKRSGDPRSVHLLLPNEEVLARIGEISVRHGQLDAVIKMLIKDLSGVSLAEAVDATDRQSSNDLRVRVRKLALKRFGESATLVKVDALLSRSRRATEKRNELLHALWAVERDGPSVWRKQGSGFEEVPPVSELKALAEDLLQIHNDIITARFEGFLKLAMTLQ